MPYEIQLPDGTIVGDIPDDLDPSAAKAQILKAYPELALGEKRTWGEAAKDVAASLGVGVGSLLQVPGQVAGLVTRKVDETTGLQGAGKRLETFAEQAKSPVLRAKEAARSQQIAQAEGLLDEAGTAIGATLKDPSLLGSFIFEQVPNLIGTMGGGLLTRGVVKVAMKNATDDVFAKAGVRGAIGTGATMQGADIGTATYENVYNELISQGVDEQTATREALSRGRMAAVQAAAITLGTSYGAGATIERALTRGMAGVPKTGIIRGTLGETLSEAVEEGGGQLVSNIQLQGVAPETDVFKGVGAAAGLGAVGGALFGLPASFVNKANAVELEKAKAQLEEAKRKAAETLQPQTVNLAIGYDPTVEGSGVYTPIIVNPDGTTIFPSERNQFAPTATSELSEKGFREKYGIRSPEQIKDMTFDADRIRSFGISPKANLYKNKDVLGADIAKPEEAAKVKEALEDYLKKYPKANPTIRKNIEDYLARPEFQPLPVSETATEITEATTTPEADAKAIRDRMVEGFKNRPEIKKIYDEYDQFMQARDVDKAALSAFNTVVSPEVLKNLGINPVASIYQDAEVVNADLSVPENADRVRAKLMAFKEQSKSQRVKDNIDTYLNRAEFLTPQYVYDILNPPIEEGKEAGQEQFVFIDPAGNIQSHYGNIVKRGNKRFAKYKGGERELTEDVLVNPNPTQVEILDLYKRKEKLMKEPDEFKKWLMGFGIDPSERADIGVDKRVPNRLFRRGGFYLDDLLKIALEQDILSVADIDITQPDGGVQDFRDLIRTSLDGGFVPTPNNVRVMADLESIQNNIEYLENELKGAPEEAIAEEFRGEKTTEEKPPAPPKEVEEEAPSEEVKPPTATTTTEEIPLYEYSEGINTAMMDAIPNLNITSQAAIDTLIANDLVKQDPDGRLHLLPKGNALLAEIRAFSKLSDKAKTIEAQKALFAKYIPPEGKGTLESREGGKPSKISKAEQKLEQELTGKTIAEVSDWSVTNAPNRFAKAIAKMVNKRIKELEARGIKLSFVIHSGNTRKVWMQNAKGSVNFDYSANTPANIELNLNGAAVLDNQLGYPSGMNYTTILHELLHVATSGQLFMESKNDPLVVELNNLRNQVVKYYNERAAKKDLTPFMQRIYNQEINALRNIDELVSWGLTDKDMQEFLSQIKVGEKTAFTKLVQLIREILGINKEYETALDRLIRTSESVLSEDIDVIGDRIISRGYSFGQKPTGKQGASGQGTLFQKEMKGTFEGLSDDEKNLLRKQFVQEEATVSQKFENLKDNFFERFITGVFDEFRAIKKYTTEGYMMARLSKSIDGGLQGLLEHGQVYLKDGALDIRPGTKGLLEILEPLGTEVDQYQMWKALNRDARMPPDKRSFDDATIQLRDKLIQGKLNGKSRKEVYEKALQEENELNKSVLDVARETGLIDNAAYQVFSNDIYYIPFYKQMEDGSVDAVNASSKLTGQYFSKALKGGEKKVNDLMENVLLNWSHILSASMKNQATTKTIESAESMGAAEKVKPVDGKYPPNTVKFMENGKTVHYALSDPDLVDAISTISYLGPKSAFLDIAKGFTNALRYGVTLSPAYKIRNLIRDSMSSAAVSELGPNMFENVYNGLRMSSKGDPTFMAALAGGGIFEMGTAHEGDQARLIKRLIDKGIKEATILDTPEKIKGKLQDLLNSYNELGNRFENANRLALYKKLRESGKSHLEASFAARDLMDFSMQGQFRTVKIIASLVPFFNARLQGLYKLGRDGITPTYRLIYNATTGKETSLSDKQKAQRFMTMSSAIMLASILLYGIYKDDEDFQRREGWDRDNFWWFKIGDVAFRIPKPFEIGALGTIAERTYEQLADEGVEGKVFAERLNHILMDTFSLNPMPQMIKPLIDIYANKDSFTGAPIESAGMERLSKQERMTNKTSGVAVALGGISEGAAKILTFNPDAQGISPIQMDYFIKAYLGWMGATAVSTADLAVEPFKEGTRVRKPVIDTLAMGFIKTEPELQSKYMTQFYENNAKLQSALADMRHYAELGDMEKVTKILEEKGDKIALSKVYDKATKQLAELRKQSRIIENSKDLSTEDKRAEMNRLKILMSDIARQMEEIRKSR
jgi:hypothetical protein